MTDPLLEERSVALEGMLAEVRRLVAELDEAIGPLPWEARVCDHPMAGRIFMAAAQVSSLVRSLDPEAK